MNQIDVIAILGPTAVGKTALSLQIAKQFNGEIINGDSMQVYRGFHIGTAKISKEEQAGIPHHLLDICNVHESYNVARFQKDVRQKIAEIHQRGRLPIIVGGTGLYIQAALYDFSFEEHSSGTESKRRQELMQLAEEKGPLAVYKILQVYPKEMLPIDLHPNNVKRVIRTIEKLENGEAIGVQEEAKRPLYRVHLFGLKMERERLYNRINTRVDLMMQQGLLEEARRLYQAKGEASSGLFAAIGYKEFFPYFEGNETLETAINQVKQNSRNYAKRQFTYFRNKMDLTWICMENQPNTDELLRYFSFLRKEDINNC